MAATGVTIEELPDETPAAAPAAATPAADDAGAASDGSDDMPELESAEATAAPTEVHTLQTTTTSTSTSTTSFSSFLRTSWHWKRLFLLWCDVGAACLLGHECTSNCTVAAIILCCTPQHGASPPTMQRVHLCSCMCCGAVSLGGATVCGCCCLVPTARVCQPCV